LLIVSLKTERQKPRRQKATFRPRRNFSQSAAKAQRNEMERSFCGEDSEVFRCAENTAVRKIFKIRRKR